MVLSLFDDASEEDRAVMKVLHEIPGWPIDVVKDLNSIDRLRSAFPDVDLHAEAVKLSAWLEDAMERQPKKRKWDHRRRFTNWVANSTKFVKSTGGTKTEEQRKADAAQHAAWLKEMGLDDDD